MNYTFTKSIKNKLFAYTWVSGYGLNSKKEEVKKPTKQQGALLDPALDKSHSPKGASDFLESLLTQQSRCFVLVRSTPLVRALKGVVSEIGWKYDFIANDRNGTSIDKGFVPTDRPYIICELEQEILGLQNFPEMLLEETGAGISFFCIPQERKKAFLDWISGSEKPLPEEFLLKGELFIHVLHGSEFACFDALLIKSVAELDKNLKRLHVEVVEARKQN